MSRKRAADNCRERPQKRCPATLLRLYYAVSARQAEDGILGFNSKDGVFAIKAENEEEKAQLKTSAAAICNLIIVFFDADINEAKVERE